jgi:hypothetical protein
VCAVQQRLIANRRGGYSGNAHRGILGVRPSGDGRRSHHWTRNFGRSPLVDRADADSQTNIVRRAQTPGPPGRAHRCQANVDDHRPEGTVLPIVTWIVAIAVLRREMDATAPRVGSVVRAGETVTLPPGGGRTKATPRICVLHGQWRRSRAVDRRPVGASGDRALATMCTCRRVSRTRRSTGARGRPYSLGRGPTRTSRRAS